MTIHAHAEITVIPLWPEGVPTLPRIILIMGVAGSGKTTIGRALAAQLAWPYFEADSFHSPANRAKMARQLPPRS